MCVYIDRYVDMDLDGSMNFWWTSGARAILCEAILVRDTERRGEDGESRSKGYGFIAFKAWHRQPLSTAGGTRFHLSVGFSRIAAALV